MFVPFGQAQKGQTEGTGLGLYSVKCSTDALGGSCGVRNNTPLPGCTFWLKIPYIKDVLDDMTLSLDVVSIPKSKFGEPIKSISADSLSTITQPSHIMELKDIITKKNLTAIIVDDVPTIRKLLTKTLMTLGFNNVVSYENGHLGLQALMASEYDICFSDVQMPVMTGPEVIYHRTLLNYIL